MSVQPASFHSDSNDPNLSLAIPVQPELLGKIAQAIPDIGKVTTLVAQDPTLEKQVLEVVNIQCLGKTQPLENFDQAITVLGLGGLVNVLKAVLLADSFSLEKDAKLEAYWNHARATAAAAGILANELTGAKPDEAYLLGLFCDCGIPLLYQKFNNYFSILAKAYNDPMARIIEIENKHHKLNHAMVSQQVAKAWELPQAVVKAIDDHHNPNRLQCQSAGPAESNLDRLCATLKLAEHVTRTSLTYGHTSKNYEWEVYKKSILKLIDKPPQTILDVVNATVARLRQLHWQKF